ncbi:hypothetical protein [Streptomyces pseudovenezuelae]|uniref:hypothetical protein n=1 Tax=Streptomyces pseudovenezuelae TaxID=67350 RepID=UPI002E8219AA|nr:hypothetical protein [Streptomyces pseudovenezuelae]WUA88536.1 hypothetical protein OHO81_15030 [Streptomyces pseudovenezuelae]
MIDPIPPVAAGPTADNAQPAPGLPDGPALGRLVFPTAGTTSTSTRARGDDDREDQGNEHP